MSERCDAYEVLQVDPKSPEDRIRRAYRGLARRFHPDGVEPDADRMIEINLAYDKLKTRDRRARYDRSCRLPVAVGPGVPNVGAEQAQWDGPLARRRAATDPGAETIVDFGQYAGWTVAQIARCDPNYLRWLSRHSSGIRFKAAIERCLPGEKDLGRRTAWIR